MDGGEWRDVDGTVTIPGSPVQLDVVTARPVLGAERVLAGRWGDSEVPRLAGRVPGRRPQRH